MIDTKLLAAIRQRPDDDAPRLVYADWLEERGELPRANLIRQQCRLAAVPAWERDAGEARREVDQLLSDHGARWRGELPALPGLAWTTFSRGFVDGVRVADVATLYQHAAAIAETALVSRVELASCNELQAELPPGGVPWLRTLRVTWSWRNFHVRTERSLLGEPPELEVVIPAGATGDVLAGRGDRSLARLVVVGGHTAAAAIVERLAALPAARGLRELAIGTRFVDHDTGYYNDPTLGADGARQLLAGRLERIEVLDLSRQRVGDDGLAALVDSLPRLRELVARGCTLAQLGWFDTPVVAPAARAPEVAPAPVSAKRRRVVAAGTPRPAEGYAHVTRLDLGDNAIGDDGARAIARAPRLARLAALALDVCELTGAGVAALVDSPCWHELRELDLSGNPLGIDGAVALAGAPRPRRLHALRLADVDLGAEAAHVLAGVPWLDQLATVDLSRNQLCAELVGALHGVRDLRLTGCAPLDAATGEALATIWQRAWRVDLRGTPLADGVELPAESPTLYRLELGYNLLTPDQLRRLATGAFPRLRRLELAGHRIGDDLLAALLASPLVGELTALGLANASLKSESLKRLADAPPPRLQVLDLSANPADEQTRMYVTRAEALRRVAVVVVRGIGWPRLVAERAEMDARFGQGWYERRRGDVDPEFDEFARGREEAEEDE